MNIFQQVTPWLRVLHSMISSFSWAWRQPCSLLYCCVPCSLLYSCSLTLPRGTDNSLPSHQPCRLLFGAVPDRNALGQEAGAQLRRGTAQISLHSAAASSPPSPSKPQLRAVRDPTEENEGKGKAQMNHLHLVGMTPLKCPWHRSCSR